MAMKKTFGPGTTKKGPGMGKGPKRKMSGYGGGGAAKPPMAPKAATPSRKPPLVNDGGMAPSRGAPTPAAPRSAAMSTPGHVSNYGGDKSSYLGHFRSSENLSRGHNAGMPGGGMTTKPVFNATTNPIAAARQAGAGRVGMQEARAERQARNAAGFKASDRASLKQAKGVARATNQATAAGAKASQQAASQAQQANVQGAKQGLRQATGGVRQARQALRQTIKGGNVGGVQGAFGALSGAKQAKQTAKQGVRAARKTKMAGGLPSLV